jgi:hypothetical protein
METTQNNKLSQNEYKTAAILNKNAFLLGAARKINKITVNVE